MGVVSWVHGLEYRIDMYGLMVKGLWRGKGGWWEALGMVIVIFFNFVGLY